MNKVKLKTVKWKVKVKGNPSKSLYWEITIYPEENFNCYGDFARHLNKELHYNFVFNVSNRGSGDNHNLCLFITDGIISIAQQMCDKLNEGEASLEPLCPFCFGKLILSQDMEDVYYSDPLQCACILTCACGFYQNRGLTIYNDE